VNQKEPRGFKASPRRGVESKRAICAQNAGSNDTFSYAAPRACALMQCAAFNICVTYMHTHTPAVCLLVMHLTGEFDGVYGMLAAAAGIFLNAVERKI
jgi:hypothetical protein